LDALVEDPAENRIVHDERIRSAPKSVGVCVHAVLCFGTASIRIAPITPLVVQPVLSAS
jgi:hypothetical protein